MAIASRRPADLRLVRTADPFDDDVIDLDVATLIIIDHPDDARLTGDEFTIVHSVCVSDGAGVAQTLAMPTASTGLLVQFAADATLQDRSAALAMAGAHQVETVHTRSAESGELVLIELGIQATVVESIKGSLREQGQAAVQGLQRPCILGDIQADASPMK